MTFWVQRTASFLAKAGQSAEVAVQALARRLKRGRRIHDDERGLEAIQTVMILAIAAVALILVKSYWQYIAEFFTLAIDIFIEN